MSTGAGRLRRLVPRDDPTRVVTRRAAAFVIDAGVVVLVILLVAVVTPGSVEIDGGCPQVVPEDHACFEWNDQAYLIDGRNALLYFVVLAIALVLVFVVLRRALGTTLGKWLLRIRVVDADGHPAGRRQSVLRTLALPVDIFTLLLPIGLWLALLTPGHRRVGDHLARTWVVRADAVGEPISPGSRRPGR